MTRTNDMEKIGDKLIRLRMQHALDKNELAFILRISVIAYANLESGASEINLAQLCKISDFYKVSRSSVVGVENPVLIGIKERINKLKVHLQKSEIVLEVLKKKIADLAPEDDPTSSP